MRRIVRVCLHVPGFAAFFLWEVLLSNLRLARVVLSPLRDLRPAVVGVPLDVSTPGQVTLLANLITLTPGSLSLDVSTDRRTLYVHAVHVEDTGEFRRAIKNGLERRVRELFA